MRSSAVCLPYLFAVIVVALSLGGLATGGEQERTAWQPPWREDGGSPVHAYRGPVREEFLQCDQGLCPLPERPAAEAGPTGEPQQAKVPAADHGTTVSLPADAPDSLAAEQTAPPAPGQTQVTVTKKDAALPEVRPHAVTASGERSMPASRQQVSRSRAVAADGKADRRSPARQSPAPGATVAAPSAALDEKSAYQAALALVRNGRLEEGAAQLQAQLERYPSGIYAANAEYWLGEACYSQGKYEEALQHFRNVGSRHPQHHKNADALLRAGMTLDRLGDSAGAGEAFRQVLRRFPSSGAAALIRKKGWVRP